MKLYEINLEIMRLADAIPFDEETGEILGDVDEFYQQIESLQMEKQRILEYLAKLVLNLRSEEEALKTEEKRLAYRKTSHVEVEDPTKAVRWLKRNKFLTAFRVPEPEVAKTEVRKLISAGKKIPGCSIVDDVSCKLK